MKIEKNRYCRDMELVRRHDRFQRALKVVFVSAFGLMAGLADLEASNPGTELKGGDLCIFQQGKSWLIGRFTGYLQVSEVGFFVDKDGKAASSAVPLADMSDSEPRIKNQVFSRVDIYAVLFSSKPDALARVADAVASQEMWVKSALVSPSVLSLAKSDPP